MHIFWREFYQSKISPDENVECEQEQESDNTPKWSGIAKKLKWTNQLVVWDFYNLDKSPMDEVKQKASAWFQITYEPWIKYMKQNVRTNRTRLQERPNEQSQQFRELLSFAWLVYPVLLEIYKDKDPETTNDSHVTRKRKRTSKKNYPNKRRSQRIRRIAQ